MKFIPLLLFSLYLPFNALFCAPPAYEKAPIADASIQGGIAIIVKDKIITLEDISSEMAQSHQELYIVIDQLIRTKLEELEAKRRDISVDDGEVTSEIERMADQNHMSVMQLYEAMQSVRGLSEKALKTRLKHQLLSRKLFNAITFSKVQEPSKSVLQSYYELHINEFSHPSSFTVIIYQSANRQLLQEKISNPMFYSPEVKSEEATLQYAQINPRLANILAKTKSSSFTPILPSPDGGSMSFYIKEKSQSQPLDFDANIDVIKQEWMAQKREQVLSDHFARLRDSTDVKILRLPAS